MWTADAAAAQASQSSGTVPVGFCAAGYSSFNIAFIVSLLVDIVFQVSCGALKLNAADSKENVLLDLHVLFDMAILEAAGALCWYERALPWR